MKTRADLLKRARRLRSRMRALGPLLRGSVVLREMRCGKPTCRCTRGQPHTYLVVTLKEQGKSRTIYVDANRQDDARQWSANYKRFKVLLKEHSEALLELLKRQPPGKVTRKG